MENSNVFYLSLLSRVSFNRISAMKGRAGEGDGAQASFCWSRLN